MAFMDDNFMLKGEASKTIYESIKDMPIFDFHCHLDPQEIYEDKPYNSITEVWLGGDHYKWRLMRAAGVPEAKITGDASDKEKFQAYAEVIGKAFGNPLFHFTHLEMKNYFGIEEHLNADNWEEMYNKLNAHIQETKMSPRKLLKDSKVTYVGTTDAPLDDLEWHKKLAEDDTLDIKVAPTFRPDAAFVQHKDFAQFAKDLAAKTNREINNFDSFVNGLADRVKYFANHGCQATDISFDEVVYSPATEDELNVIFNKAVNGEVITKEEADKWQTEIYTELCGLYKQYNFVTLVHFGAMRNNNKPYFEKLGGDAGFDSIGDQTELSENLNGFLNSLQEKDKMPKMSWYNINPAYNTMVANTIANFQANEEGVENRLQFGAAWWFADTKQGMLDQMETLGQQGLLANFIGMLTDSRSFLSFARHDYFRRLLASLLGEWVDDGEIPADFEFINGIAKDISYNNAAAFFDN